MIAFHGFSGGAYQDPNDPAWASDDQEPSWIEQLASNYTAPKEPELTWWQHALILISCILLASAAAGVVWLVWMVFAIRGLD